MSSPFPIKRMASLDRKASFNRAGLIQLWQEQSTGWGTSIHAGESNSGLQESLQGRGARPGYRPLIPSVRLTPTSDTSCTHITRKNPQTSATQAMQCDARRDTALCPLYTSKWAPRDSQPSSPSHTACGSCLPHIQVLHRSTFCNTAVYFDEPRRKSNIEKSPIGCVS